MSSDHTQHQSDESVERSKQLSLRRTTPPGQVPGYNIDRFLGSGAYGEVWVGVAENTGRKVAIKFYTRRTSVDVALLSREVEKLVFLSTDRYVVQLLDVGWDADPPYYIMDFIENGSLEDLLLKQGAMSPSDAVAMFHEVAVGLSHLHNRGVLHCDLKPANILLDNQNSPRLADFGQARLSHEQAPALGTLFFMAPEQADLDAIPDARWDVYALGALLYCMLTGSPPHKSSNLTEELESQIDIGDRLARYRITLQKSPKPSGHRKIPGVDRALVDIIDRSLAIDPNERFDSVQSVLLALRQREESQSRRPLMLVGLVVPLVLLMITGFFGWSLHNQAVSQTDEELRKKAQESNQWAARFAGRSVGEQLDQYFRTVESLSKDRTLLHELIFLTQENEETRQQLLQLADLTQADSVETAELRKAFIQNSDRATLQRWFDDLLTRREEFPRVASWFVCDRNGVQVASAFETTLVSNTVGKCYAYRTYFHGGVTDMTMSDVPPVNGLTLRTHITETHLSAIFASEATTTWKVAISAPIFQNGEFLGLFAATVEMGNFVEFPGGDSRYAMLVDMREGPNRGAILEHPYFDELNRLGKALPKEKAFSKLDPALFAGDLNSFVPPLMNEFKNLPADSKWLAASEDVVRRHNPWTAREGSERIETGLVVLALQDIESAVSPAHQLGSRLATLAVICLVVLFSVILIVWWIVWRLMRKSDKRIERILVATDKTGHKLSMPTELYTPSQTTRMSE